MAKAKLESMDGGRKLGKDLEVDVPDPVTSPRRTNRPVELTPTQITESESKAALASLRDPAIPIEGERDLRVALTETRDRILRMKSSRPYWEKIDYAQRLMLNGALALAQEVLGDKDDAGLPLTLSRFLGLQFPR